MSRSKLSRAALRPASGSSLPGPENIRRAVLSNGIVVLCRANFNSPSVVINGYVRLGSLQDPDEKLGLADFAVSALLRGTARRSFQQIYDALESSGASLSFSGGTHVSSFYGRALAEDLPLLLGLLVEALQQPVFPQEQVERLRAQILTGLAIRAQDTEEMASLTSDSLVYAGHPYQRPDEGYPETIQAITRDDLEAFHRRCCGPGGMMVSVVGAVDPSRAIEAISQALGDWSNPSQPEAIQLPPLKRLELAARRHVPIPGKFQSDIVIGAAGPARHSPDFLAAALGNSVLGQFGMMGRLGEVVREQEGLAYQVQSSLGGGMGPGPWYISAGVAPQHVGAAVDLLLQEVRRFVREPVSMDELADSQANFLGRLPLSMESNGGVASSLLLLERYQLGLDYFQRYPGLINAVTVEQVQETAWRYLDPERLAIVVAGPPPEAE